MDTDTGWGILWPQRTDDNGSVLEPYVQRGWWMWDESTAKFHGFEKSRDHRGLRIDVINPDGQSIGYYYWTEGDRRCGPQWYPAPDPAEVDKALRAIGLSLDQRAGIWGVVIEALGSK
jgi:hypothetical protein